MTKETEPTSGPPEESEGRPLSLSGVLDLIEAAAKADSVTFGEIVDAFGRRAFGPMLLIPALVAVLPIIGALPLVSILTSLIEILIAAQLLLGAQVPWLPARLRSLVLPSRALIRGLNWVRPPARLIGRFTRPRWRFLARGFVTPAIGLLALILGIGMFIGALVPGGIVPAALIMILLGVGVSSQDGVVIVIALALTVAAGSGAWFALR